MTWGNDIPGWSWMIRADTIRVVTMYYVGDRLGLCGAFCLIKVRFLFICMPKLSLVCYGVYKKICPFISKKLLVTSMHGDGENPE